MDDKELKAKSKKIIAGTVVAATVLGSGLAADALGADEKSKYEKSVGSSIITDIGYDTVDTFSLGEKLEGVEQVKGRTGVSLLANFILTPLWFIFKLIFKLASPVLAPFFSFLRFAVITFLAVAFGLKLKYPDVPLKEILTKKRTGLIFAVITSAYIITACLPIFFPDIEKYINITKIVAGVVATTVVLLKIKVFRPKKVKYDIQFS